jgi:AraC family transcriptional regulator
MQMEPHVDGAFRMSVVERGRVREVHRSREEDGAALSVVTKPAGARHANRFGPEGARVCSVVVPLGALEGPDRDVSLLRRWHWTHRGPVARHAATVLAACREPGPDRPAALREALSGLVDGLTGAQSEKERSAAPRWLHQVRDRLHDTYEAPASVAELADDAGVHPTHLTRRFRRHFGATVTAYRTHLRVEAAAAALASSSRPLASVALACGFYDQSHLTRVFRKHVGWTPGAFRQMIREGEGPTL